MSNAKQKTTKRKSRKDENRFRVWFKSGDSVVMFGKYPNDVIDQLPPSMAMQVASVDEDVD